MTNLNLQIDQCLSYKTSLFISLCFSFLMHIAICLKQFQTNPTSNSMLHYSKVSWINNCVVPFSLFSSKQIKLFPCWGKNGICAQPQVRIFSSHHDHHHELKMLKIIWFHFLPFVMYFLFNKNRFMFAIYQKSFCYQATNLGYFHHNTTT